jgi:outer membrane protein assembly factor BamB
MRWAMMCILGVGWVYWPTVWRSRTFNVANTVGDYTHRTFPSNGRWEFCNCASDGAPAAAEPPPQPSPGLPGEAEKKAEAATQPTSFSAFHGGGGMLGVAPPIGPPPMRVRWTFSTKVEERAAAPDPSPTTTPSTQPHHEAQAGIEGAPTIDGQSVYVADGGGTLHAIDLATGKQRWTYHSDDGFETSPLVMNGRVYIGDLSGIFHAVSVADGKKLWTFDAENTIHSSANAVDGNIVFGTDGADIFCLSPEGKQLWQAKAGDRINGAPAVAGGSVFVSGCDAQLRALKVGTGEEQFASDIGALAPGSPVVLDDRIIIGTDQGRVVAMPRDGGKSLWEFDGVAEHAMVYGSPATADGIVVVGARDRNVYALDVATGKLLWTFPTRGDVDASPLISSGRVYIASRDRHLYVLNLKTGKELWSFNAARPISASPAIGSGVLVLADTGGTVRCLEPVGK